MTNTHPSLGCPPSPHLLPSPWSLTTAQIDTACAWWGRALSHHRFDAIGHNSATGIWLACLAAERFRKPPHDIVQTYTQALGISLKRTPCRRLIVDYQPEGVLADALEMANLPEHWKLPTGLQFPRKTCMEFALDGRTWVHYQSDTQSWLIA